MPSATSGAGLPVRPATPPRCALGDLLAAVPALTSGGAGGDVIVRGCTLDSRAVEPGDLYAALPGARAHGADFLDQAVQRGAVAVLTDPAGAERAARAGLPALVAPDPRSVLGEVAARVHDSPAAGMTVLGVTGTNGKTTTSYLMEAGLRASGAVTGLVGGVEVRIAGEVVPSVRTTPEATDLQGLFAVMRERGVTAVAMEVSSHALSLGRVDGVVYDAAAFTNLSQDHLDFHGTMAEYEAAKASLFTPRRSRRGVVNLDDPAGRRLAVRPQVPTWGYGEGGDWQVSDLESGPTGSRFRLRGPGVDLPAGVRLPGDYNVGNAVAAVATLVAAGVDAAAAVDGVAGLPGVPGRMERVDEGQPFLAVVDFAHTPDAVKTLLRAVRAVTTGRVLVVLGCGGDRDRGKRPLMGRAAVDGADLAVLTSDNPRSEDPLAILAEVAADAPGAVVEPDRRTAIASAVAAARPGDSLVVAGKGHETGQEVAGVVAPFDDRVVLRELLRQVHA